MQLEMELHALEKKEEDKANKARLVDVEFFF